MRNLLQKLHIYAGLQTCIGLLVYSAATVVGSLKPLPLPPADGAAEVTTVAVDGGQGSAKKVARRVKERLGWPVSSPPRGVREEDGVVSFATQSASAIRKVAYSRSDKRATVETKARDLGHFMVEIHVLLQLDPRQAHPALVAWSWFNLVSGLSLLFLVGSGVYLFLVTKKKPWYAWAAFASASGAFVAIVVGMQ